MNQLSRVLAFAIITTLGGSLTPFPAFAISTAPSPVDSVDPLVGTDAHGHTFPGATVPFGMVQLSPDTRTKTWDGVSGYHYSDSSIQGFSHTHLLGTGCGDLGDILLMPTVGDVHLDAGSPGNGYVSRFSHSNETAKPGYYRVFLDDPKVTAELTATARTGFHRYTFPATDQGHIILDLEHSIGSKVNEAGLTVEDTTTVSGYRKTHGWASDRGIYFVAKFSSPFGGFGIEQDGQRLPANSKNARGKDLKAYFDYSTSANQPILVKVGISPTSIESARKNLQTENPGWDFDGIRKAAADQWNTALNSVEIETSDPHVRTTFYSNLYFSLLAPTLFDDADDAYFGMDHKVHPSPGFDTYTAFSLWDTYRAEAPLLELVQPKRVSDMMQSLLVEYRELNKHSTPHWPLWGNETWCMIGYHSVDELADAYLKGFNVGDPEALYQAMKDTAMQDNRGQGSYTKMGYVPSEPKQKATSKTLEFAEDDWCIARVAEALGHADDAAMFYQRAANYRNVFDGTSRFMRGRLADGSWRTPFDKLGLVNDEYVEADAWQYAFYVQQDVPGMIALYGGDSGFIEKLDALFSEDPTVHSGDPDISGMIGQYSQGDEQCHHVAYLYDYAGQPWKTQQHVRQIMTTQYNDTPSGECGNLDCGQMSAWYVLSAMGFYPVNPASGVYAIGSPMVDKAVLHLDPSLFKGGTFTVTAHNNSPDNIYIQSATLNGKKLDNPWFTHTQLAAGGELVLEMGKDPNPSWGAAPASRPPPTMPAGFQYAPLPAPATPIASLPRQVPMRIVCGSNQPVGDFLPDPAMEDGKINNDPSANIDTSSANSAPAAVYQSEIFAHDFRYELPVPHGGPYLVRLHFAELFDGRNMRHEDIAINDQPVLKDFDIFAEAGGAKKALVEDFPNITPDAHDNIVIRVSTTKGSRDHNAKISGIEILPMNQANASNIRTTDSR